MAHVYTQSCLLCPQKKLVYSSFLKLCAHLEEYHELESNVFSCIHHPDEVFDSLNEFKNHVQSEHRLRIADFGDVFTWSTSIITESERTVPEFEFPTNFGSAEREKIASLASGIRRRFNLDSHGMKFFVTQASNLVNDANRMGTKVDFSKISTDEKRIRLLRREVPLPFPQVAQLGSSEKSVAGKNVLKAAHGYFVPFLKTLDTLLRFPIYEKYCGRQWGGDYLRFSGVYTSSTGPIPTIYIALSMDEFEVGAKRHKLVACLFEVLNVPPEERSQVEGMHLLFIANDEDLNLPHAVDIITRDFVEGLKRGAEGVLLGPKKKSYNIKLAFVSGRNSVINSMLGLEDEINDAVRFCRSCYCDKNHCCHTFKYEDFEKRTMDLHRQHLQEIENLNRDERPMLQEQYGILMRSPLLEIPGFEFQHCVHDPVEVLLEDGVLSLEVQHLLHYLIRGRERFTFNQFTEDALFWKYSSCDVADRPDTLDEAIMNPDGPTPTMKAMTLYTLSQELPFIVSKYLLLEDLDHMRNYCRLLQLSQFLLWAAKIDQKQAEAARAHYLVYLNEFARLYPGANASPKYHFLAHIFEHILTFGPARYFSTLHFEGHYNMFTKKSRYLKNFINIPRSLSDFHQKWMLSAMLGEDGCLNKEFLVQHYVMPGSQPFASSTIDKRLKYLLRRDCQSYGEKLELNGVKYSKGDFIEISSPLDDIPQFAKIDCFVEQSGHLYLCLDTYGPPTFDDIKCGFWVGDNTEKAVLSLWDLKTLAHCPARQQDGETWITRKNVGFLILF